MLPPSTTLKQNILNLQPTTDEVQGITNLVNVIGAYMDLVQGGPTGSVGIFALDNSVMIAALSSLRPVSDNSWVSAFANAWQSACQLATITPGTVSNPVWLGSGTLDVATLPTGAATITTIPAGTSTLTTALNNATPDITAPQAMADGFRDATLDFIFTCIGLGPPPTFIPIPLPIQAE